jgi:hypothetical protein
VQEEESEDHEHEISQSINDKVTSIKIKPREMEKFDLLVFYSDIRIFLCFILILEKKSELIVSHSPAKKGLKWYLVTRVEFTREREGQVEKASPHFRTNNRRRI